MLLLIKQNISSMNIQENTLSSLESTKTKHCQSNYQTKQNPRQRTHLKQNKHAGIAERRDISVQNASNLQRTS